MSPRLCPPAGSALKVAVLVAATGLGSARPALGQGGPSAELCNRGTITLHAARALHSLSILTGDTYQVEGWFTIEPGRCQTVFMAGNGDEAYVGFTAMDSHERLRHVAAIPARDMGIIQGAAQTICVAATAFKYAVRTKTELSRCKLGYQAMEFSLYIDPSQAHAERTTLDVAPSEQVLGTVLDNSNSANARLIFGDSVYLYGTEWSFINGRRLPAELIDRKTGLPPLLPKWQHDHTRSPVADDVAKLKDMLRAFRTCTVNVGFRFQISEPRFDLDDYGVVLASEVSAMQMSDGLHPSTSSDGAAIANLDLAGAAIREMGPDCILVSIACKGGQCVRSGSSATVYWAIHLNTRDQANEALAILRSIATYYPDGRGEITGKR